MTQSLVVKEDGTGKANREVVVKDVDGEAAETAGIRDA